MLGELQRRATVADGELGLVELAALRALLQATLERAFAHVVHQEERALAKLRRGSIPFPVVSLMPVAFARRGIRGARRRQPAEGCNNEGEQRLLHGLLR